MKTYKIVIALMVAISISGSSGYAVEGCAASSWNPELYSFYGAKDTITQKLGHIPAKLSERRVFVQITQAQSNAYVKLYERQKDGTFNVTEWTAQDAGELVAAIDKAIVANKGVNCIGEQVDGLLRKNLKEGKVSKSVPAPESTEAAFAHPVKEATGDFIKTTIVILC